MLVCAPISWPLLDVTRELLLAYYSHPFFLPLNQSGIICLSTAASVQGPQLWFSPWGHLALWNCSGSQFSCSTCFKTIAFVFYCICSFCFSCWLCTVAPCWWLLTTMIKHIHEKVLVWPKSLQIERLSCEKFRTLLSTNLKGQWVIVIISSISLVDWLLQ